MSKKIYISPSNQTANVYATGNTNEQAQCKKIAKACYDYLKKAGFNVKCTYNMDMYKRVEESNKFKADIHLCIHTNATEKHNITGGTQVYAYNLDGERKKVVQAVFNQLSPITIGKSAEKILAKPEFYEVKKASGITVYVEAEFHDTKEGSDFIIKNTKKIGEAIAKGICDYYKVKYPEEEKKTTTNNKTNKKLYRVVVGAFAEKKNAEAYVKKLKAKGIDSYIIE